MNKILKYTIPAILVGLAVAIAAQAQVATPNFWRKVGNNLYPVTVSSTVIGSSTYSGAFNNLNVSGTCTGCGAGGGGVSTSTANKWSALQTFNAGASSSFVQASIIDTGGQVFNVTAYGAKCDGVTNDTTAFSNTIAAASAVHGTMFIPNSSSGCIVTPNVLQINGQMGVTGAGQYSAKLSDVATTTQNTWIFYVNGTSSVTFSNFFLSGAPSSPLGTAPVNNTWGINATNDSGVTIDHVHFEQFYEDVEGSNVSGLLFAYNTDFTGLTNGTGTKDLINIDSLSSSTISNNIAYVSDTCIRLNGAQQVNVVSNVCPNNGIEIGNESNYVDTINVVGNVLNGGVTMVVFQVTTSTTELIDGYTVGVNHVNIYGNTINGALMNGTGNSILGENSNNATGTIANVNVSGNIIDSTSTYTDGGAGILAMNGGGVAYHWTIEGNTIYDTPHEGIRLFSCVDCIVLGNTISNFNLALGGGPGNVAARGAGIRVEGTTAATSTSVSVLNNFIDGFNNGGSGGSNNAGHGIYLGSSTNLSAINLIGNQIINVPNGSIYYADTAPSGNVQTWNNGAIGFGGALNASGTITQNGTTVCLRTTCISTSTNLTSANFAANTVPSIATTTKSIYDGAPLSTDDVPMFYTETAFTLKQVDCVNDKVGGNTATFNITWGTNRNSTTSNAFTSNYACTATTTIATNTINGSTTVSAGSIVRVIFSAASSTGVYIDLKF